LGDSLPDFSQGIIIMIILFRAQLSGLISNAVYFEDMDRLIRSAFEILANPLNYFFGPPRIATKVN
jgi:hypothetical protein